MTDEKDDRITGKQVLADTVTLLKDLGTFMLDLSKTIIAEMRELFASQKDDKNDEDTQS